MTRGESKAHSGPTRSPRSKNNPATKSGQPENAGSRERGKGGNNEVAQAAEHWENFDHNQSPKGHE